MRRRIPWNEVQTLFDRGHTVQDCCQRFGFTYGAWAKAAKRGDVIFPDSRCDRRRRHDWKSVQAYYDEGHTLVECISRFRFCRGAWQKAKRRGEIKPRPLALPLDVLLATSRSRHAIKRRLMQAGLIQNRCDFCGISEWQGEPISIQIDHMNGVRDDHRVENLRMLCPNCHSQTPTYGNRRRPTPELQETRRSCSISVLGIPG